MRISTTRAVSRPCSRSSGRRTACTASTWRSTPRDGRQCRQCVAGRQWRLGRYRFSRAASGSRTRCRLAITRPACGDQCGREYACCLRADIESAGRAAAGAAEDLSPSHSSLLVPHHGSRTSSSPAFVECTARRDSPSCRQDSAIAGDFRRQDVVRRWQRSGCHRADDSHLGCRQPANLPDEAGRRRRANSATRIADTGTRRLTRTQLDRYGAGIFRPVTVYFDFP